MLRSTLACLAALAVLVLVPATAAAQCTGGAVGDQYCDPLGPAGGHNGGSGGGAGGTGAGGSASGSGSGSSVSGSGGGSGSSNNISEAAANRAHLKTGLPATGLPVLPILGFGVALLASGLALRQLDGETIR